MGPEVIDISAITAEEATKIAKISAYLRTNGKKILISDMTPEKVAKVLANRKDKPQVKCSQGLGCDAIGKHKDLLKKVCKKCKIDKKTDAPRCPECNTKDPWVGSECYGEKWKANDKTMKVENRKFVTHDQLNKMKIIPSLADLKQHREYLRKKQRKVLIRRIPELTQLSGIPEC